MCGLSQKLYWLLCYTFLWILTSDDDDCDPDPCLNGGACTDGVDSFSCACAAGYSGATCATSMYAYCIADLGQNYLTKYFGSCNKKKEKEILRRGIMSGQQSYIKGFW